MTIQKQFLLVQIYCGKATPVFTGDVRICQLKKRQFPKQKGVSFQIRTTEGFKAVPILTNKKKKHEK